MLTRTVYLYIKGNDLLGIQNILREYQDIQVTSLNDHFLKLNIAVDISSEVIRNARELSLGELYQDFTVFIVPLEFEIPVEPFLNILPRLSSDIYTIDMLITECVMLGKWDALKNLKNYYYTLFNAEVIETILGFIDQNLNATKTAKALYMHRNTLNYRLDNFIHKTEIDVRTFAGAMAIHLLFRR